MATLSARTCKAIPPSFADRIEGVVVTQADRDIAAAATINAYAFTINSRSLNIASNNMHQMQSRLYPTTNGLNDFSFHFDNKEMIIFTAEMESAAAAL